MFTDSKEYNDIIELMYIIGNLSSALQFIKSINKKMTYQYISVIDNAYSGLSIKIDIVASGVLYNEMSIYDILLVDGITYFQLKLNDNMKVTTITWSNNSL